MTGLGLGLLWGGYLFLTYGFTMIRGYQLTLSDLALPTHRVAALAIIEAGPPNAGSSSSSPATLQPGGTIPGTLITPTVTKNKNGTETINP